MTQALAPQVSRDASPPIGMVIACINIVHQFQIKQNEDRKVMHLVFQYRDGALCSGSLPLVAHMLAPAGDRAGASMCAVGVSFLTAA